MLSAQGLGFVQGIQGLNVKCSGFRVCSRDSGA